MLISLSAIAEKPTHESLLAQCKSAIETQIGSEKKYAKEIFIIEHKFGCQVGVTFEGTENWGKFGKTRVDAGKYPDHLATDKWNPIKLKFEIIKSK